VKGGTQLVQRTGQFGRANKWDDGDGARGTLKVWGITASRAEVRGGRVEHGPDQIPPDWDRVRRDEER